MADIKCGRRMVWRFLLSTMAACLASGAALAACNPSTSPGTVPCYIRVQPIDVANTQTLGVPAEPTVVYNPFNSTSPNVECVTGTTPLPCPSPSTTAGMVFQTPKVSAANIPALIPNNSTSGSPIGFVVQQATGASPFPGTGSPAVDVTRELLKQVGIDLVWLPMTEYVYPACPNTGTTNPLCVAAPVDYTALDVTLAPAMLPNTNPPKPNVIASCMGSISGTVLTITTACTVPGSTTTPASLLVYDILGPDTTVTGGLIQPNTYITGLLTGQAGGIGSTYRITPSQTVGTKKPVSITATASILTSSKFKGLSQQCTTGQPCPITPPPPAISQAGTTPLAPLGGAALTPTPFTDPTIINMFFVNSLNPPTGIGGTLYGLAWICNNGVAISSQTFSDGRPDTLAHELLHNLCLDHTTYGAGPWIAPGAGYAAPFGVVPLIPNTPVVGECDANYSACGANLMTAGIARTEATLACILADPSQTLPTGCTSASPGFLNPNALADRLSFPSCSGPNCPPLSASTTQLPVSQETVVIGGGQSGLNSGLLSPNSPTLQFSGLLSPIPQETTKAQLGTSGSSAGRAIFDLSSPAGGKPGETLLGWVLTLPRGKSFSRHDGFHIVSQSREDLVQDVKYYPGPGNNPLTRNIGYQRGGDNNANDPTIAAADQGPCAFTTTECMVVKFQPPGLGADESISFSNSIVSGDAPITNEDLCKAQITYVFSDGYVTTSNFGVCSAPALPLIANSWHPDPHVAPHVVQSNVLLAQSSTPLGCTPDPVTGQCPPVDQTSISDADALQEAGAPQHCDNGATTRGSVSNPVTGIISGPNIIIQGGSTCHYRDCQFLGSLTINNATAYLQNCDVAGQITMTSGNLYTLPLNPQNPTNAPSVSVNGNIAIGSNNGSNQHLPNSFSIGPGTTGHNLTIQNLPSGGLGYVCNSTFSGGVNVNNNASSIQIGDNPQETNCPGNFIAGGLECKGNTPLPNGQLTGGQNNIQPTGGGTGQCTGFGLN